MSTKPKIDVTSVWHIALALPDLDKTVERYWKDLGVGPWQCLKIETPEHATRVYGKPMAVGVNAAITQVGFLNLGIDQPYYKPNPFEEMISKRGGGAHHLACVVEDMEHARTQMQSLGYREILWANGIGPNGDGGASYFDTVEDMGTVIELSKLPSQMPSVDKVYPAGDEVKRASDINVRSVPHVAIAVRDAEKAARCYEEVLGMGPAEIITANELAATYLGKETRSSIKVALIKKGDFVLALEQPLSSPYPLQDFIDKNGQGIHHVCFEVDDVRRSSEEMQRLGYAEVFSVYNFGPNADGDAAYFDTENTLGIVVELAKPPTGW